MIEHLIGDGPQFVSLHKLFGEVVDQVIEIGEEAAGLGVEASAPETAQEAKQRFLTPLLRPDPFWCRSKVNKSF
jgi:hypothetical protein